MRKIAPLTFCCLFLFLGNAAFSAEEPETGETWTVPTEEQLRNDLQGWLDVFVADQSLRDQILASWPTG